MWPNTQFPADLVTFTKKTFIAFIVLLVPLLLFYTSFFFFIFVNVMKKSYW